MNLANAGLHIFRMMYVPIAIGIWSVGILKRVKPKIIVPIIEPIKNLGNNGHWTWVIEKSILEELLATWVMPWIGMIIFELKKIGSMAIRSMPPPKPITPAIRDVRSEISPNINSMLNLLLKSV